ncbi:MAG: hypothetical protein JNL11_17450 [Bdellovibrionaceae bacterium]|nr:hypothetical protein [Pseudobdellovibrionaceae bacterium]
MKLTLLFLSLTLSTVGCVNLSELRDRVNRGFSRDGLTPEERYAKEREDREKFKAEQEAAEAAHWAALEECQKKARADKLTDMKRWDKCYPSTRQGLSKNNHAAFFLYYDGNKPTYVYFDKNEKFLIIELDQEAIDARRDEYRRANEVAENQRLMRLQMYFSNENSRQLNDTIRKQNCIRNSSPNTAMYCY